MNAAEEPSQSAFARRLHRIFAIYAACLLCFLMLMAMAERAGL